MEHGPQLLQRLPEGLHVTGLGLRPAAPQRGEQQLQGLRPRLHPGEGLGDLLEVGTSRIEVLGATLLAHLGQHRLGPQMLVASPAVPVLGPLGRHPHRLQVLLGDRTSGGERLLPVGHLVLGISNCVAGALHRGPRRVVRDELPRCCHAVLHPGHGCGRGVALHLRAVERSPPRRGRLPSRTLLHAHRLGGLARCLQGLPRREGGRLGIRHGRCLPLGLLDPHPSVGGIGPPILHGATLQGRLQLGIHRVPVGRCPLHRRVQPVGMGHVLGPHLGQGLGQRPAGRLDLGVVRAPRRQDVHLHTRHLQQGGRPHRSLPGPLVSGQLPPVEHHRHRGITGHPQPGTGRVAPGGRGPQGVLGGRDAGERVVVDDVPLEQGTDRPLPLAQRVEALHRTLQRGQLRGGTRERHLVLRRPGGRTCLGLGLLGLLPPGHHLRHGLLGGLLRLQRCLPNLLRDGFRLGRLRRLGQQCLPCGLIRHGALVVPARRHQRLLRGGRRSPLGLRGRPRLLGLSPAGGRGGHCLGCTLLRIAQRGHPAHVPLQRLHGGPGLFLGLYGCLLLPTQPLQLTGLPAACRPVGPRIGLDPLHQAGRLVEVLPGVSPGHGVERSGQPARLPQPVDHERALLQQLQGLAQGLVPVLVQQGDHVVVRIVTRQRLPRAVWAELRARTLHPLLGVGEPLPTHGQLGRDGRALVATDRLGVLDVLLLGRGLLREQHVQGPDQRALAGLVRPLDHQHPRLGHLQAVVVDAAEVLDLQRVDPHARSPAIAYR